METLLSRTTTQGLQPMGRFEFATELANCPHHGEFQDMRTPVGMAGCPKCNADRIAAEDAKRQAEIGQEFRQRRADGLLRRAAIPPRFSSRRLENFTPHAEGPRKALEVARQYVAN